MFQKLQAMKKNKKKGFTLIELIVVIAILAILAALAVPQYNGLREKSAQAVADANARSVYTAAKAVESLGEVKIDDTKFKDEVVTMLDSADFDSDNLEVTTSSSRVTGAKWIGEVNGKSMTGTYTAGNTSSGD